MTEEIKLYQIDQDDLRGLDGVPAFVTFGETMVRETPADNERPERTRQVYLSMAGSEYTLAMGLARLGIPASYITRVPENPYGRALRNIAREKRRQHQPFRLGAQGRTHRALHLRDRPHAAQEHRRLPAQVFRRLQTRRRHGRLGRRAQGLRALPHSGISFGLSTHSGYERNYNLAAFLEAAAARPEGCLDGTRLQLSRNALVTGAGAGHDDADGRGPCRHPDHLHRRHGPTLRHGLRPVFGQTDGRR